MFRRSIIIAGLACLSALPAWAAEEAPAPSRCLLLSDIHFNPLGDGEDARAFVQLNEAPAEQWEGLLQAQGGGAYPSYDDDTNYPLWRDALENLSRTARGCDYAVITGDHVVHHFEKAFKSLNKKAGTRYDFEAFLVKTEAFLQQSLARRLPGVPLYWVLGNNDSDQGNYNVQPRSSFLSDLVRPWTAIAADAAAAKDFAAGGYYRVQLPGTGQRVLLVLNSNFWYLHYDDGGAAKESRPGKVEMDWLAAQLALAAQAGAQVTLAMHIPPGIDAHPSLCGTDPQPYFDPEDEAALEALLVQYRDHLGVIFAAHTHFDDWRVLRSQGHPVAAVHLVPSISPVHHNNPSFQIALFDGASGALQDIETYGPGALVPSAGPWALQARFTQAYHLPDAGLASADRLTQALRHEAGSRALFRRLYDGGSEKAAPETLQHLQAILCAQTCFNVEDYRACICSH